MRASAFFAGITAELPILLGVVPFGLIYGVLALQAGIPAAAALGMSSILFAGSAQFVATQLFGAGVPGAVLLLTTFIVNLRHLLYSASVAPYVRHLSPGWKWLLAYLLTDEAYAVTIVHYTTVTRKRDNAVTRERHWFFLGAGLALWMTWQASTAVGIFLGAQVPAGWQLDFALPLTFIALVRPSLVDRPGVAAAIVAGVVATAAVTLPLRLGLIIAALAGIITGTLADRGRTA
ncbi:MAG: AzlC family ABC transporter permease [Armatimonadetes bacterium]|nr:AzlC family ABC transporter permease [Armatimonadota bacterium]